MGVKAEGQHQQGMFDQEAAQRGTIEQALPEFEQQGFEVGALRMRAMAAPMRIRRRFSHHTPIQQVKEGTHALAECIVLDEKGHGRLVVASCWLRFYASLYLGTKRLEYETWHKAPSPSDTTNLGHLKSRFLHRAFGGTIPVTIPK